MLSKLSIEFLKWILNENKNDISKWNMLDKNNVPEAFGNNLWSILDELESNSIVKNVRKYGQTSKQQCDFSFLPIALDYANEDVDLGNTQNQAQTINIIENQKNVSNEFNGPIHNSNISTGDNANQEVNVNLDADDKGGWISKNKKWFVPTIVGAIVTILTTVAIILWG